MYFWHSVLLGFIFIQLLTINPMRLNQTHDLRGTDTSGQPEDPSQTRSVGSLASVLRSVVAAHM